MIPPPCDRLSGHDGRKGAHGKWQLVSEGYSWHTRPAHVSLAIMEVRARRKLPERGRAAFSKEWADARGPGGDKEPIRLSE
jgi:hypothetical protein